MREDRRFTWLESVDYGQVFVLNGHPYMKIEDEYDDQLIVLDLKTGKSSHASMVWNISDSWNQAQIKVLEW